MTRSRVSRLIDDLNLAVWAALLLLTVLLAHH